MIIMATNLFVLAVLMLLTRQTFVAQVVYDPSSTDETDDQEPNTETGEYEALSCDKPIILKHLGETVNVCGDKNKTLLRYFSDDENDLSPTWSYRGINEPREWHKIDPILFNMDYDPQLAPSLNAKNKRVPAVEEEAGANNSNDTSVQREPGYYGGVPSFMRLGGQLPENFCDSPMPSPIVIDTSKAKLQDSLSEFEFLNMGQNFSIQMYFPEDGTDLLTVRTFHAWGMDNAPCISKGSVIGTDLCLDRILIHYGTDGLTGSEHQFVNQTYAMELQFFFTVQDGPLRVAKDFYYVYLNEYLKSGPTDKNKVKGKLVQVLSVFVRVVDDIETEPNLHFLAEMAQLFWTEKNPERIRSFTTVEEVFNFAPLFPKSVYYTYKGSLTFPPCFPDLDWVVFEKPLNISRQDFESFLFVPSEFDESGFVAGNFRNVKDIYIQMEDRMVNKDPTSRQQCEQNRKNRPISKSLPPEDKTRDAVYDYYEDDKAGVQLLAPSASLAIFVVVMALLYHLNLHISR